MTDLHTRKNGSAFADWSREAAGERLKNSVSIINQYATFGVAVLCDLREIKRLAPTSSPKVSEKYLDLFSSAYATCCHLAMFHLGSLVEEHGDKSRIAYFFERRDKNQSEADRFWTLVAGSELADAYRHYSHTVMSKRDCRIFEMSDILAWEWAKQRERVAEGRHMRPSLRRLLDPNDDGFSSPIDYASKKRGERFT